MIGALIGYGLLGAPDSMYQPLIEMATAGSGTVISLDIPTGVDASTGERHGAAIAADATFALAVPKRGVDADGLFAAEPLLRLV